MPSHRMSRRSILQGAAAAALATMAYGAQTAMPRREDVEDLLKSLEAPLNAEGKTHA